MEQVCGIIFVPPENLFSQTEGKFVFSFYLNLQLKTIVKTKMH